MNTKQRELIRDLERYLELKLQGYREVDHLPEEHAMVQTPVRLLERVRMLVPGPAPRGWKQIEGGIEQ
jgi:hypothetical protein